MTNDASKDANEQPQTTTGTQQSARTDDLLASGAESRDGAQGFEGKAGPDALQTGMEGIAGATVGKGNRQSGSPVPDPANQTLPDNAGQVRNKQGS